jgi:hypothetical protein
MQKYMKFLGLDFFLLKIVVIGINYNKKNIYSLKIKLQTYSIVSNKGQTHLNSFFFDHGFSQWSIMDF